MPGWSYQMESPRTDGVVSVKASFTTSHANTFPAKCVTSVVIWFWRSVAISAGVVVELLAYGCNHDGNCVCQQRLWPRTRIPLAWANATSSSPGWKLYEIGRASCRERGQISVGAGC